MVYKFFAKQFLRSQLIDWKTKLVSDAIEDLQMLPILRSHHKFKVP